MELRDAIRRRRMCRSFTEREVDAATVDALLDRARRAPSAGNTQGWAWLVLEGAESTRRFWELDADPAWLAAPTYPGLLNAPVILVPWSNPAAYRERYGEADKSARGRPGGRVAAPAEPDRPGYPVAPDGARETARERPDGTGGRSGEGLAGGTGQGLAGGTGRDLGRGQEGGVGDWPVPWWDVDLAFSVMILLLSATDLGLGALFFALHGDPVAIARAYDVPAGWRPLGAIALGWPDPDSRPSASAARGRRPADEVIHRGTW